MPVKKFKSFEEAEKDLWCFKPDENYYKRIKKLFKEASELSNTHYPPGVYKYKTFKEAQDDMHRWQLESQNTERKNKEV